MKKAAATSRHQLPPSISMATAAAEIVYLDTQKLYILDGRDGATLFEMAITRTNDTPPRYPAIADVDNDGNAEIIVPTAAAYVAAHTRAMASWCWATSKITGSTRAEFWNKWQYTVTNVNEDAGIPRVARNNFQIFNNQRAQAPIDGMDRFRRRI